MGTNTGPVTGHGEPRVVPWLLAVRVSINKHIISRKHLRAQIMIPHKMVFLCQPECCQILMILPYLFQVKLWAFQVIFLLYIEISFCEESLPVLYPGLLDFSFDYLRDTVRIRIKTLSRFHKKHILLEMNTIHEKQILHYWK